MLVRVLLVLHIHIHMHIHLHLHTHTRTYIYILAAPPPPPFPQGGRVKSPSCYPLNHDLGGLGAWTIYIWYLFIFPTITICCLVCSAIHLPFAKALYCPIFFCKRGISMAMLWAMLVQQTVPLFASEIHSRIQLGPAEERYSLQACPSLPSNSNFRSSLFFPPGGQDMEMWSRMRLMLDFSLLQWGWHKETRGQNQF